MAFDLIDRYFGCLCGTFIGSSMGAAVEGMPYEAIEAKYGTLEKLLPYIHYNNGWERLPGTTEDGIERQKLMIEAIVKKQDRVTAEDVKAMWLEKLDPDTIPFVSEPFELQLLRMARAGIPGVEIGRYCDYSGLNSFARACHPIGLINAGDPLHALEDVMEVGRLYQTAGNRGLKWAAVTGVAVAAACTPGATVESVLGAVFDHCDPDIVLKELDRELTRTVNIRDLRGLREHFAGVYSGGGIPYAMSYANEVVTKGVCVFRMCEGDLKQALICAVNLGRDTDCIAAVAGGITGALSGGATAPQEWVAAVDRATEANPYTNTKKTIRRTAEDLSSAYQSRLEAMERLQKLYG